MTIGQRLREKRREKGLTLKALAEATDLTVAYLSDVERNQTQPSLKTLGRVAAGLGITTTDLIAGVDLLGEATTEALPAGLQALRDDPSWKDLLTEDWINTLQRIEYRGKRLESKNDWMELFLSIRRILNPSGE